MKQMGIQGVWRGKGKITTKQRPGQQSPDDLVKRNFSADAPNKKRRLRSSAPQVADFTYIKTKSGRVYTAFMNGYILPMDMYRLNEEIAEHCFARVQDVGLCPKWNRLSCRLRQQAPIV